jgi:hypothetical protein
MAVAAWDWNDDNSIIHIIFLKEDSALIAVSPRKEECVLAKPFRRRRKITSDCNFNVKNPDVLMRFPPTGVESTPKDVNH